MNNAAHPRILLVDDDHNILQVMQIRLKLMGYRVVACIDPQEALSIFEQGNFSIVLTDQRMQGLRGSDLVNEIHLRDPHVPIIIMTAYGTVDDAVESVRQGAYTYLQKPVDTKELEMHIKRGLGNSVAEQRLTQERHTWERIVESVKAALVVLNSDLTVAWMNSVAQSLYKVENFSQGQLCAEIIPQGSLPCAHCPAKVALLSGKTQSVEHYNSTTDRWLLVTVTPIQDLQGNIVQAAELALDITEIKQAQDVLLKQERLKGVFEMAGAAAHELSQPMQSILGWGELLRYRISENDPNFKILRSICQNIEKLGDLTTKIRNVDCHVTKDYPGNLNIIDLDRASTQKK
ncbi:MAG: response regulator [Deltaproteobacteria bacterium]|nr:response regulator [Deltaproteobacteria bacterium]MBW2081074.1 response regulator [Deltaproteobacteria bacterium]MBW2351048.1 response regulator [Deltaproteobacteria bacterium]